MHLVIGASGNVGLEVTRLLRARGAPVRVLTREPHAREFPKGVEVVKGDLADRSSLQRAMPGVEKLYCLMRPGTAENVVAAAREAGVHHIVLLTSLAAEAPANGNPLAQAHQLAERAVTEAGIAHTFLHPTGFSSNTLAWATGIRAHSTVRAPFTSLRTAVIDPRDIAAVAVQALISDEHLGKTYALTGPEAVSIKDQVRILSELLGRPLELVEQSEDEARAQMIRRMPPEVASALLAAQRASLDAEPRVLPTVQELTGRSARTYAQWASDHIAAFA